ncbi:MAG: 3-hydroxybutyryl-CoA dehydrogenase (EC; 3-hydroxyacyl-CoA dehydrogenase (EC [uncultured Paraburkholderia sp.]|nr:MAG: 3-hydroxybutyryl-CoA dehydrogenase (EC; 3-hydroxyacyl-CoA dehydrogenase (EC [uncultured Paraburkholderia sp.]CAH2942152.1 MAG: 3-hydroxybutyryl-CoA dehydrogenase (EC; 3-hydroxyacyl-CoA dehydrogenase (EC [uncultured Paraburkholderia sp.]
MQREWELKEDLRKVGIVGAGAMGRGIAQVCAIAGCSVQLFDAAQGAVSRAIDAVREDLARATAKGVMSQSDAEAAIARIVGIDSLDDMRGCDLMVEAIVERLDAKQQLFRELETIVDEQCVLATNTSSLSVTGIAAACTHPNRVAGWHFFNPVTRMKVVEVIRGPRTDVRATDALVSLARRIGHRAIVTSDSPGFVVNHAGRAFVTEGLKLLAEQTANHEVLDAILRTCAGFRMGPMELLDLTGLDVSVPVMESIHSQYYGDDRYRPVPLARTRLVAGLLGRKTGEGFYRYDGKPAGHTTLQPVASNAVQPKLWWPTHGPAALPEAITALLDAHAPVVDIGDADVVLLAPLDRDLSATVVELGVDASKAIGVDPIFGGLSGITLMTCPATDAETVSLAEGVFAAHSVPTFVIADSPGFVAPRVVACVVNLACEMAQQGIASPEDIDVAVRLGLGYPLGPFEWGDRLGAAHVLSILKGLYETFGDQRYRPSLWLARRAWLGLPLASPDRREPVAETSQPVSGAAEKAATA